MRRRLAKRPIRPAKQLLDLRDPKAVAQAFVKDYCRNGHRQMLHCYHGTFYEWTGTHYAETSDREVKAALYKYLVRPTTHQVTGALDALKARVHVPDYYEPPIWLDSERALDNVIACRNGLLDIKTRRLSRASPRLFNLNALSFDYDRRAPKPERWLAFLDDLWGDDSESISTLQELMGYLLTSDTSQQKAFMLVGPKRAGKGTIMAVATALVGADNVVEPSLKSLGEHFGLEPLIGRTLAIIGDARVSARTDTDQLASHLLGITGEDGQTIHRKHRSAWTGQLKTRFVVLSNEVPRIVTCRAPWHRGSSCLR
jgi:putative DNA primase/helicase